MTQSELIEKYPELFGEPPFDPKKTLLAFGFEVSKHWAPVLEKGFGDLSKIIKQEDLTDFRITQVKEKYGELVVNCLYYTDSIDEVIDTMEKEALTICEKCGSREGKHRTEGTWFQVTCDACQEKENDGY